MNQSRRIRQVGDLQFFCMIFQESVMHHVIHADIACDLASAMAIYRVVILNLGSHTVSPILSSFKRLEEAYISIENFGHMAR